MIEYIKPLRTSSGIRFGYYTDRTEEEDEKQIYKPVVNSRKDSRQINQYTPEREFVQRWPSIGAAAKAFGTGISNIRGACDGTYKSASGYLWRFADDDDIEADYMKEFADKPREKNGMVPIFQLTIEGDFVRRWEGVSAAAYAMGVAPSGISACLRGNSKSAKGFKWVYAIGYRAPKRITQKTIDEIRRLNNQGIGARKIGEILGISHSTAEKYLYPKARKGGAGNAK